MRTAVNLLIGVAGLVLFGAAFAGAIWVLYMREERRQQQARMDAAVERILTEGDSRG